ncbi:MAG: DUF4832 domain-containing protein [Candidatus Diapherotrites archaeon]
MLKKVSLVFVIVFSLFFVFASGNGLQGPESISYSFTQVEFSESNEVLANPDIGWVDHKPFEGIPEWLRNYTKLGYARSYWDQGNVYFTWELFNPMQGVYDFSKIDELINEWSSHEAKIGFRIRPPMDCGEQHFIPEWARNLGATESCSEWDGINFWRPDYTKCVFQENYGEFIQVLAERYDENENISFIDFGSYESFGEWWGWHVSFPHDIDSVEYWSKIRIIEMFSGTWERDFDGNLILDECGNKILGSREIPCINEQGITEMRTYSYTGFENKLNHLLINWGGRRNLAEAGKRTAGTRMDGVGIPSAQWSYYFDVTQRFSDLSFPDGTTGFDYDLIWMRSPVMGEFASTVDPSDPLMLEKTACFVKAAHLSSIHNNFGNYNFNQEGFLDLLRVLGYRLVPVSASYSSDLMPMEEFFISMNWKNSGSAPIYKNYLVELYFKNQQGKTVWRKELNNVNLNEVMPAMISMNESSECISETPMIYNFSESFFLPKEMPSGNYEIYFAVINPNTGVKEINLAIENGLNKGYYLGEFELKNLFSASNRS